MFLGAFLLKEEERWSKQTNRAMLSQAQDLIASIILTQDFASR